MAQGLKLNFSQEEASSEALAIDPLPTGKYHVKVTDIETRESKSEKNFGKPYWHMEYVVQDGPYENRKIWTNVMLFEGALFSLAQLLKATGNDEALKTGKIPDADEFIGKDIIVNVAKQRDTYAMRDDPNGPPIFKNEVKGHATYDAKAQTGAGAPSGGGKSSLLP